MKTSLPNNPLTYRMILALICIFIIFSLLTGCDSKFDQREGVDFILLIDDSRSMLNSDPDNMRDDIVKFWFKALKENNQSGKNRIGIIRFATDAYISKGLEKVLDQFSSSGNVKEIN